MGDLQQESAAGALLAVYYLYIGLYFALKFWPLTLFAVVLSVVAVFAGRSSKNQPR